MSNRIAELASLLSSQIISSAESQEQIRLVLHDISNLQYLQIIIENNPDFTLIRNALFMFSKIFLNEIQKLDFNCIVSYAGFFLEMIEKRNDIFSKSSSLTHTMGDVYAQVITEGIKISKLIIDSQINEVKRIHEVHPIPVFVFISCMCQRFIENDLQAIYRNDLERLYIDIFNLLMNSLPNYITNGTILIEQLEFINSVYNLYITNGVFMKPWNLVPFKISNECSIQYFGLFEEYFSECSTECKFYTLDIMNKMIQSNSIQKLDIIIPSLQSLFQQAIDLDGKCALVIWNMLNNFASASKELFRDSKDLSILSHYENFLRYIGSVSQEEICHDSLIMTPEIINQILIFWSKIHHINFKTEELTFFDLVSQITATLNDIFLDLILSNPAEYESYIFSTDDQNHTDLVRNYASFCMSNPSDCVASFIDKFDRVSTSFLSNASNVDSSVDASMGAMLCFASSLLISLNHKDQTDNENAGVINSLLIFVENSNQVLESYRDSSENLSAELSLIKLILLLDLTALGSYNDKFSRIRMILSTDERIVNYDMIIGIFADRIINDLRIFPGATMLLRIVIKCLEKDCIYRYICDNEEIRNLLIGMRNPLKYEFLGSIESQSILHNFFRLTSRMLMNEDIEKIQEIFEELNAGLYEAFSTEDPHVQNPNIASIVFVQIESIFSISNMPERYQKVFWWFSTTHLDFFVEIAKEIIENEITIVPFMRLWFQLIISRGNRISFPDNSSFGVQLFIKTSKVLQAFNERLLVTMEGAQLSDLTKLIKIYFNNAWAALSAPYVCFGVFSKYGSDAVDKIICGIENFISKTSIKSLLEFPSVRKSALDLFKTISARHSELLVGHPGLLKNIIIAADANICFGDSSGYESLALSILNNVPTGVFEEASLLQCVERIGFHAMQTMITNKVCNLYNVLQGAWNHTNIMSPIIEYVESISPPECFDEYYASVVSQFNGTEEEPPNPSIDYFQKYVSIVSRLPISYQHIDLNPYIDIE